MIFRIIGIFSLSFFLLSCKEQKVATVSIPESFVLPKGIDLKDDEVKSMSSKVVGNRFEVHSGTKRYVTSFKSKEDYEQYELKPDGSKGSLMSGKWKFDKKQGLCLQSQTGENCFPVTTTGFNFGNIGTLKNKEGQEFNVEFLKGIQ